MRSYDNQDPPDETDILPPASTVRYTESRRQASSCLDCRNAQWEESLSSNGAAVSHPLRCVQTMEASLPKGLSRGPSESGVAIVGLP